LSKDIGDLMNNWLPKNKVRPDRHQSKTLVYQVRQLIGHFNVAAAQLKQQEESYQNDLKLELQRRDKEIKTLREDNKRVLQLQDDLAEKDDVITSLKKELETLKQERDMLEEQSREAQDNFTEVTKQVQVLQREMSQKDSMIMTYNQQAEFLKEVHKKPKSGLNALADVEGSEESDDENGSEDEKEEPPKHAPEQNKGRSRKITKWRQELQDGSRLDAKDETGLWWSASVVEEKGNKVKVRYDGWGDNYDEWIEKGSDRIAYFKEKTAVEDDSNKRIIKQGWMMKEGKMFKTWRKRWFVLDDAGTISYYSNKGDDNAIQTFSIKNMKQTTLQQFGKNKPYGVQIETTDRMWKFMCESERDLLDWIHAIQFVKNGIFTDEEEEQEHENEEEDVE